MIFEDEQLIFYKEKTRIVTIDYIDDINNLFNFLSSIDAEFEESASESVKERLLCLFKTFRFPITVIYEPYYVDRVYRDEFYRYYSKKHFKISRNTKRIIFIQNKYAKEDFLKHEQGMHEKIQNDLIGMAVLKPTQTIGRMLINPYKVNLPKCYLHMTKFEISILGGLYYLEAFPFSGQDTEVMTCSEVNIWQIMEYFGSKYSEYKTLLPSEMFDQLYKKADGRILPSEGLTLEQESFVFFQNGLSPKIYNKYEHYENGDHITIKDVYFEPSFEEILNLYIESGIPILVNLRDKDRIDGEHHSVTFIGHGYKEFDSSIQQLPCKTINFSKKYIDTRTEKEYNKLNVFKTWNRHDEFVIMEDHSTPYQVKDIHELQFGINGIKWEIDSFVVPLYKHVFLVAEDAYDITMYLINKGYEEIIDIIDGNNLLIRLYLTPSKLYKDFRVSHADSIVEREFFAHATYPKYLWICEYGTFDSYCCHKAIGEFVLDATSSKHKMMESVISIRQGNNITYRASDDPVKNSLIRLDIPIDAEFSMFEQNNLKFINN